MREFVAAQVVNVCIGILTTFIGILLVYLVARPRLQYDHVFRVTRRKKGRDRYRIRFKARNRLLRVTHLAVTASVKIKTPRRSTHVPVPLSRSEWLGIRQPKKEKNWNAAPRLLLDEVDWKRHLPPDMNRPEHPLQLESLLRELDAELIVAVLATSAVFGVSEVFRHSYGSEDIGDAFDSEDVD